MKLVARWVLISCAAVLAACSNSSNEAGTGGVSVAAAPDMYQKACAHLLPLAPESRRAQFTQTACETEYKALLNACGNATAVSDCLSGVKSWDERLACIDSCKRTTAPGKQ